MFRWNEYQTSAFSWNPKILYLPLKSCNLFDNMETFPNGVSVPENTGDGGELKMTRLNLNHHYKGKQQHLFYSVCWNLQCGWHNPTGKQLQPSSSPWCPLAGQGAVGQLLKHLETTSLQERSNTGRGCPDWFWRPDSITGLCAYPQYY